MTLIAVPAAEAVWEHAVESLEFADEANQKHPKKVYLTLVVGEDVDTQFYVWAAYGNNFSQKSARNRGKVTVKGEIIRELQVDGSAEGETITEIERFQLKGNVKNQLFLRDKLIDLGVKTGDMIILVFEFSNMPKMNNPRGPGGIHVRGGVTTEKKKLPDVFLVPNVPGEAPVDPGNNPGPNPAPNPNPNPNPGPNPGPGGLSAADERAIDALLNLTPRSQLWLAKNGQPKKWVFVPPTVRVISGNKIDPATAGYGNTPAEAAADLASKPRGYRLPAGRPLTAADRSGILCYSRISPSGGPTSIRRDAGKGYWGEYFRPGRGSNHQGPFSNIAGAANYLRQQLGC